MVTYFLFMNARFHKFNILKHAYIGSNARISHQMPNIDTYIYTKRPRIQYIRRVDLKIMTIECVVTKGTRCLTNFIYVL